MELNRGIRSGNKKVDEYISNLEEYILSVNGSNVMKLLLTAEALAGTIADSMSSVVTGKETITDFGPIQNNIDALMKIVDKAEKLKTLKNSLIGYTVATENAKAENQIEEMIIDLGNNAFENVLAKVKQKHGKN